MSIRQNRRLARAAAERLLSGAPEASRVDADAVVRLLSAAAAPARPDELAGEWAAVAAFRAAGAARPVVSHRRPVATVLVRFLTVKVAAVFAAALTMGGIAFAAGTGSLPGPVQDAAHGVFGAPPPASAGVVPVAPDAGAPKPRSTAPGVRSIPPTPVGSPSPSLVGLCRAYQAGVRGAGGRALDHPAFKALVSAAGGKDSVPAYCAALLADSPQRAATNSPTARPGNPNKRTAPSPFTTPAEPRPAPSP